MDISLQMYTVRKYSRKDLELCLSRLFSLGIRNLEMARISLSRDNLEIISRYKKKGMRILSHQLKFSELERSSTIEFLKKEECPTAVISVLPLSCIGNRRRFIDFLEKSKELATHYKRNGIQLCYHHHNYEAACFSKEETGFDILLPELRSGNLRLVCDTYWLQRSGFNPTDFLRRNASFIEGMHLRDFKVEKKLFCLKETDTLPGLGMMDMDNLLSAAEDCGITYAAIEADMKKPFEELERILDIDCIKKRRI